MILTTSEKVLQFVRANGMVRGRDVAAIGMSPTHLQRLYERGLLVRSGRGVYLPVEADSTEYTSLAEVTLRVPIGIMCLLTALRFHGLTTQLPHQIWIALPARAHMPHLDYPPIRVVRLSREALTTGIEEHRHENAILRVYSPAKTVADCFKFRNKIGMDVAIEALQDCWRKRCATMEELWRYAKICRVANVMRPYLESVT